MTAALPQATGEDPRYRYLNRENRWAGLRTWGVEIGPDGAARPEPLPALAGPPGPAGGPAADRGCGLVVLPGGVVFLTGHDPAVLARLGPGEQLPRTFPGAAAGALRRPVGTAHHPGRGHLVIADEDRLLFVDPAGLQLVETWTVPGCRAVAVDGAGRVVVGTDGGLRAFEATGRPVAVPDHGGPVLALAAEGDVLGVLTAAGRVELRGRDLRVERAFDTGVGEPACLALSGDRAYVADTATGRVVAFRAGRRVGTAQGRQGPVAALAVSDGTLLVHPGGGPAAPVRLDLRGAAVAVGRMVGGPYPSPDGPRHPFHLLRAAVVGGVAGLRLYVHVQAAGAPAPQADPAVPFGAQWTAAPPGATVTRFAGSSADAVWVGVELTGAGSVPTALDQLRLDHDHQGYQASLPAIFRAPPGEDDLLGRWLAAFETEFDEVHRLVDDLAVIPDPAAVPAELLGWLAGWVGLEPDGGWPVGRTRAAVAAAFDRSARRGTADGLRDAVRDATGVDVVVSEPLTHAGWWVLPDDEDAPETSTSVLGVSTTTVPAEFGGAVLGGTATLDGAFVAAPGDPAGPVFDDVAHRVVVRVHRGAGTPGPVLDRVTAVVHDEVPAHVAAHVCVIEPRLTLGRQARLGIDAVLAGAPRPVPLGEPDWRLAGAVGDPLDGGMRVGRSRLGDPAASAALEER